MIKELAAFAPVFWEARYEGRSFAAALRDDLREFITIDGRIKTEIDPDTRELAELGKAPIKMRRRQTQLARISSAEKRSMAADILARKIARIQSELHQDRKSSTLRSVADEANERGLKTSRGGTWSPPTVKRMLDRAKKLENKT
ncbi:recombinase family protein [Boseongicola aestuarii]|nr:recombinase family protein [Boseongicola aestuarii]